MAVSPVYKHGSPQTFSVVGNVRAGHVVEYVTNTTTMVQEAGADSVVVAGVAVDAAMATTNSSADVTYATGISYSGLDTSTPQNIVGVAKGGVWNLTAGANIAAFQRVKTAAGGVVVPWVTGTDAMEKVVGIAQAAITNGATGPVELRLH